MDFFEEQGVPLKIERGNRVFPESDRAVDIVDALCRYAKHPNVTLLQAWNIGAAYIYPLSKRTALKAYAGYADSGKEWKEVENVAYNGYQVYLGMRHSF